MPKRRAWSMFCAIFLGAGAAAAAPSVVLQQMRNGPEDAPVSPVTWDGNAGSLNAHYVEGWSVAFRCVMTEMPVGTPVTLLLSYDVKYSDRHALDYLTDCHRLGGAEHVAVLGHPEEVVDPTSGVAGLEGTPFTSTFPLPAPGSVGSPVPGMPTDSFEALPVAERIVTLWGGILTGIAYGPQADLGVEESTQEIEVTFTPTAATMILAWGAHIADRDDWGYSGDGVPLSAGGISGSPYHMRFIEWSLDSQTSQDLSLSAVAVHASPPVCDVNPSEITICEGGSVDFTGSAMGGLPPYDWVWNKVGNGTVLSTTSVLSIASAVPADTGEYRMIVTDSASQADTCYATLVVVPTPSVSAGPDGVLNCLNPQIVILQGSSSTPGVTYSWVASDGGHIVSGAMYPIPVVDTAGTYTLTVTEPIAGCTATDVALVTEDKEAPDVNAGADMALTSFVTLVTLDGSSSTPGVSYQWSTLDGHIVSGATTPNPTVDQAGTYVLTVTNPVNGCAAADEVVVFSGFRMLSVSDVGQDQGGQVRIQWRRELRDEAGSGTTITQYTVWRRVVDGLKKVSDVPPELTMLAYPPGSWDYVTSLPACGEDTYGTVCETLCDSTLSGGMCWSVFFVRAHTPEPLVFFDTLPDSGYSVDNIAPAVPMGLLREAPGLLTWQDPIDADFQYFTVYGSAVAHLDGSQTLIARTIGTSQDVAGLLFPYLLVTATDCHGNESEAGALTALTGVTDAPPVRFALQTCVPNPFNPMTVVHFDLPQARRVNLRVYDLAGRLVRTLVDGQELPAGRREVIWRGCDESGRRVAAGTYFCRMEAGTFRETRRMTLVK